MNLDTIALVETPEGVELHAEQVSVVPRALAYVVDFFIRLALLIAVGMVANVFGRAGWGLYLIVYFVLEWWYPVGFELLNNGQTWGKKVFDIKVVNDDLTPVTFSASLIRNLLRTVDFFPVFYIFGVISIVCTERFQRLGDLAAGTLVVYTENKQHDLSSLDDVQAIAPTLALNEEQQVAIMNFALNRNRISEDRQQELAAIVAAHLPIKSEDSASYVRGIGKWLLGAK